MFQAGRPLLSLSLCHKSEPFKRSRYVKHFFLFCLNQKLPKMRNWIFRIPVPNISVLVFEDVLVFLAVVIAVLVLCHCDKTEWSSIQGTIRKGQLRHNAFYEHDFSELLK